jgi:hypothetical protein
MGLPSYKNRPILKSEDFHGPRSWILEQRAGSISWWVVLIIPYYPWRVNLHGFKNRPEAEVARDAFRGDYFAIEMFFVHQIRWWESQGRKDIDAKTMAFLDLSRLGLV